MKENRLEGGKKKKNYGGGSGMHKHATSGIPHNHALSIAKTREENRRIEEEQKRKERIRNKGLSSRVRDIIRG